MVLSESDHVGGRSRLSGADLAGGCARDRTRRCELRRGLLDELALLPDLVGAHQRLDLGVDRRDRFAHAAGARRPYEGDLPRRVLLGVVAAVVAAAGLPALEGAFDRRSGREHRGPEVEGVGEIGESGDVRVDADIAHPLLDVRELVQARLQTGLVADDPGVLGPEVADLALEGPDV